MDNSNSFPLKEEFSPSAAEVGSHIRAIKMRLANNGQLLDAWKEYQRCALYLRREYRGREGEGLPGMMANWITAANLAKDALFILREENVSLETELAALVGQREMFKK